MSRLAQAKDLTKETQAFTFELRSTVQTKERNGGRWLPIITSSQDFNKHLKGIRYQSQISYDQGNSYSRTPLLCVSLTLYNKEGYKLDKGLVLVALADLLFQFYNKRKKFPLIHINSLIIAISARSHNRISKFSNAASFFSCLFKNLKKRLMHTPSLVLFISLFCLHGRPKEHRKLAEEALKKIKGCNLELEPFLKEMVELTSFTEINKLIFSLTSPSNTEVTPKNLVPSPQKTQRGAPGPKISNHQHSNKIKTSKEVVNDRDHQNPGKNKSWMKRVKSPKKQIDSIPNESRPLGRDTRLRKAVKHISQSAKNIRNFQTQTIQPQNNLPQQKNQQMKKNTQPQVANPQTRTERKNSIITNQPNTSHYDRHQNWSNQMFPPLPTDPSLGHQTNPQGSENTELYQSRLGANSQEESFICLDESRVTEYEDSQIDDHFSGPYQSEDPVEGRPSDKAGPRIVNLYPLHLELENGLGLPNDKYSDHETLIKSKIKMKRSRGEGHKDSNLLFLILYAICDKSDSELKVDGIKNWYRAHKVIGKDHLFKDQEVNDTPYYYLARLVSKMMKKKNLYFFKFMRMFFKILAEVHFVRETQYNPQDLFSNILYKMIESDGFEDELESGFFNFGIFIQQFYYLGFATKSSKFNVFQTFYYQAGKNYLNNNHGYEYIQDLLEKNDEYDLFHPQNRKHLIGQVYLFSDMNFEQKYQFIKKVFSYENNRGLGDMAEFCFTMDLGLADDLTEIEDLEQLMEVTQLSRKCLNDPDMKKSYTYLNNTFEQEKNYLNFFIKHQNQEFDDLDIKVGLAITGSLTSTTSERILHHLDDACLNRVGRLLEECSTVKVNLSKQAQQFIKDKLSIDHMRSQLEALIKNEEEIFLKQIITLVEKNLITEEVIVDALKNSVRQILNFDLNESHVKQSLLKVISDENRKKIKEILQSFIILEKDSKTINKSACEKEAKTLFIQLDGMATDSEQLLGGFNKLSKILSSPEPKFKFLVDHCISAKDEIKKIRNLIKNKKNGSLTYKSLSTFKELTLPGFDPDSLSEIISFMEYGDFPRFLVFYMLKKSNKTQLTDFSSFVSELIKFQNELKTNPTSPTLTLKEAYERFALMLRELKPAFEMLAGPKEFTIKVYKSLRGLQGFRELEDLERSQIFSLIGLSHEQIAHINGSIDFFKAVEFHPQFSKITKEIKNFNKSFKLSQKDLMYKEFSESASADVGNDELTYQKYKDIIDEKDLNEHIKKVGDLTIIFESIIRSFSICREVKKNGGMKIIFEMTTSEKKDNYNLDPEEIKIAETLFLNTNKYFKEGVQREGLFGFCNDFKSKLGDRPVDKGATLQQFLSSEKFEFRKKSIIDFMNDINGDDSIGLKKLSKLVSNCLYEYKLTKGKGYHLIAKTKDEKGKIEEENQEDLKYQYNKLLSFKKLEAADDDKMKEMIEKIKGYISILDNSIPLLSDLNEIYDAGYVLDLRKAIEDTSPDLKDESGFEIEEDNFSFSIQLPEKFDPRAFKDSRSFSWVKEVVNDILNKSKEEYSQITTNPKDRWILNLKGEQLRMVARYFLNGKQKKKVGNILKYCLGEDVDLDMFKTYNQKDSDQKIENAWSAIHLIKTFREQSDALRRDGEGTGFPANNTSALDNSDEVYENIRNKMEFVVVKENQFHYVTLYLVKNSTTFHGFNKYLFCTGETKKEEIQSFLRRALQDEKKSQYAIFDTQRLTKENFDFLLMLIKKEFESESIRSEELQEEVAPEDEQQKNEDQEVESHIGDLSREDDDQNQIPKKKGFNKNILFLVNLEDEGRNEITKELTKLDKIFKECSVEDLEDTSQMSDDEKEDFELSYRNCWRQNVEIVCSTFSGFGKSTYIDKRRAVSTPKLDMITLFVTAGMDKNSWNEDRLTAIDNKLLGLAGDDKINLQIKVDIFDGHEDQIYKVDQILYQILNCDRLSFTDSYIFFERVEKVFIELSSSHTAILEDTLSVVQVYRDKMEIEEDKDDYFYGGETLKENKTRFYTKIQNIHKKNIDLDLFRSKIEGFDKILNYVWLSRVEYPEKKLKGIQALSYEEVFEEDGSIKKTQSQLSQEYPDNDEKKVEFLFKLVINTLIKAAENFKLKVKRKNDLGNLSFYQILKFFKLLNYYLKTFEKEIEKTPEKVNEPEKEKEDKISENRLQLFESMVEVCFNSAFLDSHRIRCAQFETRKHYLEDRFLTKYSNNREKYGNVKNYINGPKFEISSYLSQPLFSSEEFKEGDAEEKKFKPFRLIHAADQKEGQTIDSSSIGEMSKNGFVAVKDTYAKMHMLIMMAELGMPIMIQGQTGCGKTFLVKNTSELILKHECVVKTLHNGFKESDLKEFLLENIERAKTLQQSKSNKKLWLVFDEINTAPCQCLIQEVMIEKKITFLGKEIKIPDNIVLVGIANPYDNLKPKKNKKRRALTGSKKKLSHNVNPLTDGLLNFVVDFGQLSEETERKYIRAKLESNEKVKSICVEENQISMMTEAIIICQNQIRALERVSSVSLRDVERFIKIFLFFQKNNTEFKDSLSYTICLCYLLRIGSKEGKEQLVSLINEKHKEIFKSQEEFNIEEKFNEKGLKIAEAVKRKIEFPYMIAINKALQENLFALLVCIELRIPIMISGQPGTSKSIAISIAQEALSAYVNNLHSEEDLKMFSQATFEYLWGSKTTTEHEVRKHHEKVLEIAQKNKLKIKPPANQMEDTTTGTVSKIINTCSVIEEVGQIQKAKGDPTKFIHEMVDSKESEDISIICISNWRLDDSQMNRFILVTRPDLEKKDLVQTSTKIFEAIMSKKYPELKIEEGQKDILIKVFDVLAGQFVNLRGREVMSIDDHPDFHGTRDFYSAIKYIIWNLLEEDFAKDEKEEPNSFTSFKRKIIDLIKETVEINFSGKEEKIEPDLRKKLKSVSKDHPINNQENALCSEIMKHLLWKALEESKFRDEYLEVDINKPDFVKMPHKFQMITDNLSLNSDLARFLMLFTDGEYTTSMLINKLREWHEKIKVPQMKEEEDQQASPEKENQLFGSEFVVIENVETEEQVSKELARIPIYMETGATLVMYRCDKIKSPLYDLFNQGKKEPGQESYKCRLMIKGNTQPKVVHKYFRMIILEKRGDVGKREQYKQLLPPFLNRFQKVLVKDDDLLKRLGSKIMSYYQYFRTETDNQLLAIRKSKDQEGDQDDAHKGKVVSEDLFINNYSKNSKIGAVMQEEKVEEKTSLIHIGTEKVLKKDKVTKHQKKMKYDEVMKDTYSRNYLASIINEETKKKQKLKKGDKKLKKQKIKLANLIKEFNNLNNSKGLISYLESEEEEARGLFKSLVFTYTHSSNIYSILDKSDSETAKTFSVVSVENFIKDKRAKQVEERLTTPGKSVLVIQFKGKDQWTYISEVKLILEEAIERLSKVSESKEGESKLDLQVKSLVFLAHYSNEDLKSNKEVEIAINFFTKDWAIASLDSLEGYDMEKFLGLSCERLSQVIFKNKGDFALDLVRVLLPRSISRILESKASTKDQKKAYKDLINTFKIEAESKDISQRGEEARENPGEKLCQKILNVLSKSSVILKKIQKIEGKQKRTIFDLILNFKHDILIEYTHGYMEGVASLIEKIIGAEFDYIVKKINDLISLKDRQIFEELEPFKRDEKVAEWEEKLEKIKIKKDDLEKMKKIEINPEEYFERTTSEIASLFKEIKNELQTKMDLRDTNWYKKLPQTIRFNLVKFVERLDEDEMSVYHQKQIITKLIFGDMKFNDAAIQEVQRVLEIVIQEPDDADTRSTSSSSSNHGFNEDHVSVSENGSIDIEEDTSGLKEIGGNQSIHSNQIDFDPEAEEEFQREEQARRQDLEVNESGGSQNSQSEQNDEGEDSNSEINLSGDDDDDGENSEINLSEDDDDENTEIVLSEQEHENEEDQNHQNELMSMVDDEDSSEIILPAEEEEPEDSSNDKEKEKKKVDKPQKPKYEVVKIKKSARQVKDDFDKDRDLILNSYVNRIAAMIAAGLRLREELSILASFVHNNPQMTCDEETLKSYKEAQKENPGCRLPVEKMIMRNLSYFTNCSNYTTTTRNINLLNKFQTYFDNYFSAEYSQKVGISLEEHYQRCCVAFIRCLKVILPIMRGLDIKKKASYIDQVKDVAKKVKDGMSNKGSSEHNIEEKTKEALQILIDFIISNPFIKKNEEVKLEVTQIILDNIHYLEDSTFKSLVEKSFDLIFESILDAKCVDEKLLNQVSQEIVVRIEINSNDFSLKEVPSIIERLVTKFVEAQGEERRDGVAFKILRMMGDRFVSKINDLGAKRDENKIRNLFNKLTPEAMKLDAENLNEDPFKILDLILKIACIRCMVPAIDFEKQKKLRRNLDNCILGHLDDENIALAMFLIRFIRKKLGGVRIDEIEKAGFRSSTSSFRELFDEQDLLQRKMREGRIIVLDNRLKKQKKKTKKTLKARQEIDKVDETSISQEEIIGSDEIPSSKMELYLRAEAGSIKESDLEAKGLELTEIEKIELMLFRDTRQIKSEDLKGCAQESSEEQALIQNINKYGLFLRKLPDYLNLLVTVGLRMTQICSFVITKEEIDSMKLIDFLKNSSSESVKSTVEQFLKEIKELFYPQLEDEEKVEGVLENIYLFGSEHNVKLPVEKDKLLKKLQHFSDVPRAYNELMVKDFLLIDESKDEGEPEDPESSQSETLISTLIDTCILTHNAFLSLKNEKKDQGVTQSKKRDLEKFDVKAIVSTNEKLIKILEKHSYASLEPFKEADIKLDSPKFISEVLELVFRGRKPFKTVSENCSDLKFKPKVNPDTSSETLIREFEEYKKFIGAAKTKEKGSEDHSNESGYDQLTDDVKQQISLISQESIPETISGIRNYLRGVLYFNRKWRNVDQGTTLSDWVLRLKLQQLGISKKFKNALDDLAVGEILTLDRALRAKEEGKFEFEKVNIELDNLVISRVEGQQDQDSAFVEGGDYDLDLNQLTPEKEVPLDREQDAIVGDPESSYIEQVNYHMTGNEQGGLSDKQPTIESSNFEKISSEVSSSPGQDYS